jgi:hypothetical protein
MSFRITSMARSSLQQEVAAALHAMSEQASANNLAIVADLSAGIVSRPSAVVTHPQRGKAACGVSARDHRN